MPSQPDKYANPYERGRITAIERLIPRMSGRAMDLGCGTGVVSAGLVARGFEVVGVDVDTKSLEVAAQHVPRAQFIEADLLADELPAGPFDIVTACEVIEHFAEDDQRVLLERVRERIAPDGHLIVSTPNTASVMSAVGSVVYRVQGRRWDCGDSTHRRVHNSRSLEKLLRDSGFRVKRRVGFQLLTHRPWPIARLGMREFRGIAAWICYDQVIDAVCSSPGE